MPKNADYTEYFGLDYQVFEFCSWLKNINKAGEKYGKPKLAGTLVGEKIKIASVQ